MLYTALKVYCCKARTQRELRRGSKYIRTLQVHKWVTSHRHQLMLMAGSDSVAYKNCYTTPSTLTTALIIVPGAMTGLLASPFDSNPKMKHYWAQMQSLVLTRMLSCSSGRGQLLLTSRPLRCSDIEEAFDGLSLAPASRLSLCWSNCYCHIVQSAFISLRKHPRVLHRTKA